MNASVYAVDALSMVAFFAAALVAAFTDFKSPLVTRVVRWSFVGAMTLYALIGVSNVLEHARITAYFDAYEDYAELLFIPVLTFMASTMFQSWQLEQTRQTGMATKRQADLLLNIVDTVPGGVLVVDPTGAVVFANEGAERILGVQSDSGGSLRVTPSWRLTNPVTGEDTSLEGIASEGRLVRVPLRAQWPDGRSTQLVLSATPMSGNDGHLGGSVVAFELDAGTS